MCFDTKQLEPVSFLVTLVSATSVHHSNDCKIQPSSCVTDYSFVYIASSWSVTTKHLLFWVQLHILGIWFDQRFMFINSFEKFLRGIKLWITTWTVTKHSHIHVHIYIPPVVMALNITANFLPFYAYADCFLYELDEHPASTLRDEVTS